jgi:hypothetical protein
VWRKCRTSSVSCSCMPSTLLSALLSKAMSMDDCFCRDRAVYHGQSVAWDAVLASRTPGTIGARFRRLQRVVWPGGGATLSPQRRKPKLGTERDSKRCRLNQAEPHGHQPRSPHEERGKESNAPSTRSS